MPPCSSEPSTRVDRRANDRQSTRSSSRIDHPHILPSPCWSRIDPVVRNGAGSPTRLHRAGPNLGVQKTGPPVGSLAGPCESTAEKKWGDSRGVGGGTGPRGEGGHNAILG